MTCCQYGTLSLPTGADRGGGATGGGGEMSHSRGKQRTLARLEFRDAEGVGVDDDSFGGSYQRRARAIFARCLAYREAFGSK